MVWCGNCTRHQPSQSASFSLICCNGCGKVVDQEIGSKEPTFSKVAVAKDEKEVSSLNAGKSRKFDVAKFKALQRACQNARDATRRKSDDGSESLSDIDDAEVGRYLLKEDERFYKKIIWERMNQDYSKAQAAKKVDAANGLKLKKEKQQRKSAEAKKARDTAKRTDHMLPKKRPSSKVNYDVLKEILGEPVASEKAKKSRTESYSEDDSTSNKDDMDYNKFSDWGMVDEDYDKGNSKKYQNGLYHDYEEEQFYDDNDDHFF